MARDDTSPDRLLGLSEPRPDVQRTVQRFLRLLAANVGGEATGREEAARVIEEILEEDADGVDLERLGELASLLTVATGLVGGWALEIADEQDIEIGDAMRQIEDLIWRGIRDRRDDPLPGD